MHETETLPVSSQCAATQAHRSPVATDPISFNCARWPSCKTDGTCNDGVVSMDCPALLRRKAMTVADPRRGGKRLLAKLHRRLLEGARGRAR